MIFNTPSAINAYVAITLAVALEMYARTGMKANSAYTPTAMLKQASKITGKHFKRGEYTNAAKALREFVA